jgi:hypothetical protein
MEMKTLFIIGGILVVAFILKSCISNNNSKNESRPKNAEIPTEKIQNDKIVLFENVKSEDLKNAIQKFCNNYNQEGLRALPLLTILSENKFVVTFPYDTDFATYCYFVNYMYYPNDIFHKPIIKAWTSTKQNDDWMTNEIVNKKVMLFIPSDDKDYDNVYLTTSDNIGYKMGFAMGEEKQKLNNPRQTYIEPINLEELKGKEEIQYK